VVEVDPETGGVSILRYLVVEDCGRTINPAIVEGQVRGGVAMGVGVALLEDAGYDEDGNPSSTLMDYLLPTATDVPPIEIVHIESEPLDDLDYRGVGEGGTIAAPAAIVNAIPGTVARWAEASRTPIPPPSFRPSRWRSTPACRSAAFGANAWSPPRSSSRAS